MCQPSCLLMQGHSIQHWLSDFCTPPRALLTLPSPLHLETHILKKQISTEKWCHFAHVDQSCHQPEDSAVIKSEGEEYWSERESCYQIRSSGQKDGSVSKEGWHPQQQLKSKKAARQGLFLTSCLMSRQLLLATSLYSNYLFIPFYQHIAGWMPLKAIIASSWKPMW